MKLKCLFNAMVSATLLAGLSACDDGKIATHTSLTDSSDDSGEVIVDHTLMDAVQRQIFSAHCVQCHGGSNHAAAGLYLTEELSRQNLLGVTSTVDPTQIRVIAGDHENSLLWKALATDISEEWAYDHSNLLTDNAIELMATWIDLEN